MGKGSSYERTVAVQLSLWYSHGKDDSLVWRTAMSGGRSTVRAKKGKRTAGSAGDLTFTHPDAAPLFDQVTFELKRGYAKDGLGELIDREDANKPGTFEQWVVQANKSASVGMTPNWMIIHKRNRRPAMCYMNHGLYSKLKDDGLSGGITLARPLVIWKGKIRMTDKASGFAKPITIVGLPFDQFLDLVQPESLVAKAGPNPSGSKSSKSSHKGR